MQVRSDSVQAVESQQDIKSMDSADARLDEGYAVSASWNDNSKTTVLFPTHANHKHLKQERAVGVQG